MQLASIEMTRTKYYCSQNLVSSNMLLTTDKATFMVDVSSQKTSGINAPKFDVYNEIKNTKPKIFLGLNQGGNQINNAKKSYYEALLNIIKAAELQISFISLEKEIKVTRRRENEIRIVLIPRYKNTIRHIEEELDHMDRKDFCRLKKIKQKKLEEINEDNIELEKMAYNTTNHPKYK
jgi:V-type H+-transporting ATPase subunit D